jgi:hypothetical protein
METTVQAVAILPLWLRLAVLYLAVSLTLAVYLERRAAGDSVAEAVFGVLKAAIVAPITFCVGLFAKKT